MSEKKEIFIGSIINYFALGVNILIAVFYTPFLLGKIGDINFGIRNFALSFVTYANIFGTGIATSYLRFVNLEKNKNGDEGVRDVDGVFLKIFIILGCLITVVGLVLSSLFLLKIIPLLKYDNYQILIISLVIFVSFLTVGFKLPFSVFILVVNFKRKFIFRNLRYLFSALFEHALSIVCLALGATVFKSQILLLSLISFGSEIIFSFITLIYLVKKCDYKFNFKRKVVDKKIFKEIIVFSIFSLLIVSVMSLNEATDRIILGFVSPSLVTIYSLSIIFNGYLKTFADALSVSFTPRITEAATKSEQEKVQKNYDFVNKLTSILLSFIIFGYVCCGKQFIILWLGPEKEIVYYYSLPLMIALIFVYPQHFSIQIQRAYGNQKFTAVFLSVTFLINIIISVLAVNLLESVISPVVGCIIGTIFSYLIETIGLGIYNYKKLGLKQFSTYFDIVKNLLLSCVVALVTFLLFDKLSLNNFELFIVKGFVYTILLLLIQFLINKNIFISILKNRFIRKKNKYEK